MTTQVVRPAGAGHETLQVTLLALLIALLAGLAVLWHRTPYEEPRLAADGIDARRDLNAAEQGIHADLLALAEEFAFLRESGEPLPSAGQLAEDGFPPFIADAGAARRGAHRWTQLPGGDAYYGATSDPAVAGSFLLKATDELQVWLLPGTPQTPVSPDPGALAEAGWRRVVSQYDAGVTRQHRH